MKILVTSDLHLDEWTALGHNPLNAITDHLKDLDALIIAGDLADDPLRTWPTCLAWIGRQIDPAKVYVFPGNHDYYDHQAFARPQMPLGAKKACSTGTIRRSCRQAADHLGNVGCHTLLIFQ